MRIIWVGIEQKGNEDDVQLGGPVTLLLLHPAAQLSLLPPLETVTLTMAKTMMDRSPLGAPAPTSATAVGPQQVGDDTFYFVDLHPLYRPSLSPSVPDTFALLKSPNLYPTS